MKKPGISTAAIYQRRSVSATLDSSERDKVQAARDGINEALAEPLGDAVRATLEAARDRLDEALGTTADAPDPAASGGAFAPRARRRARTIGDLVRDYYQEGTR
jgi:hypothetical protein